MLEISAVLQLVLLVLLFSLPLVPKWPLVHTLEGPLVIQAAT